MRSGRFTARVSGLRWRIAGAAVFRRDQGEGLGLDLHAVALSDRRGAIVSAADAASIRDAATFAAAFVPIAGLGFADGGYWPTAWGWSGLALAWASAVTLVLAPQVRLGRYDIALACGLLTVAGWTLASSLWSESVGRTVLEAERSIVYLAGVGLVLLVARRSGYGAILAGVWAASVLVAAYALATKLLPGRYERFDSIAGVRLAEPLGYWNALGAFAAIGAVLGLGLAAHARLPEVRAAAASSVPVLVATLYFTFSRGAWVALAAGLAVTTALDSHRLRLVASTGLVALPTAGLLAVAYRSDALTSVGAPLDDAVAAGRDLAGVVVAAAVGAGALSLLLTLVVRRIRLGPTLRRTASGVLVGVAAVAAVAAVALAGGPAALADRARASFDAPAPRIDPGESLNVRLFSLSHGGRVPHWRIARDQWSEHPLVGMGAGTYELSWVRDRPVPGKVRDAHSLYLEVLAELGLAGFLALAAALLVPFVTAFAARRHAFVPAAVGAYVVLVGHAAADWDWEMPALTLAGLLCGAAVVIAARHELPGRVPRAVIAAALATAVAAAAFAFAGLMGNAALAAGWDALERGDGDEAKAQAKRAQTWMRWSGEPWRLEAAAESLAEDEHAARANLRTAVAKDPRDWSDWFDLAQASDGREHDRALARARALNPLSPELAAYVEANAVDAGEAAR